MKNHKYVYSFLILLGFLSSSYAQSTPDTILKDPIKIRLPLDNAKGGQISDYFKPVIFIPLETSKKSLFGSIYRMEVTDDYFIVQDNDTNSILFFFRNGKFHCRINVGNKSNRPQNAIATWAINRHTKTLYYLKDQGDICYIYDFNGKKIKEQDVSKEGSWTNIEFINDHQYVSNNGYGHIGDKIKYFLSFFDYQNQLQSTALSYSEYDILNGDVLGSPNGPFYAQGQNFILYTKSYDHKIYRIENNQAFPQYQLILPLKYAVPDNFLSDQIYATKKVKYFDQNKSSVYEITNCFELGDQLFFRLRNNDRNFKSDFVYNMKTANLVTIQRMTPDESSYYLPVASDLNFVSDGFLCSDGTSLYTAISANSLSDSMKENREKLQKGSDFPENLKALKAEANPIIRQITPR